MGAGKSAVGVMLSVRTGLPFVDVDVVIEKTSGRAITAIFDEDGELAFREVERATIASIASGETSIVATGGGAVLEKTNVVTMKQSGIIWLLQTDPAALRDRLGDGRGRPLLEGTDLTARLEDLMTARTARYRDAADHVIETTGRTPDEVAATIEVTWLST